MKCTICDSELSVKLHKDDCPFKDYPLVNVKTGNFIYPETKINPNIWMGVERRIK